MITGACLCGTVSWKLDHVLDDMTHCHCSMCRKAHGAPFATYIMVTKDNFHWQSGEDTIAYFQSSPGFMRAFCSTCGSVVPDVIGDQQLAIPAGCLNEDPGVRPSAHIFAASKVPWLELTDDLPKFDGYQKPDDGPNIERPSEDESQDGVLKGSCLCGDVAYEISTPIKAVHNCHCSRCRKARAAAHATNGFTSYDGVVFVRGEDKLKNYKLPSAKYFTQVFCVRCGSCMPRLDPDRKIAIIPFGSLDSDPGCGPKHHIFTGSMATWYTIKDDLTCCEEMPVKS